ncbi:MAG: hypothetical protein U1E81_22530 [Xanthobacteraceae bacterium]
MAASPLAVNPGGFPARLDMLNHVPGKPVAAPLRPSVLVCYRLRVTQSANSEPLRVDPA